MLYIKHKRKEMGLSYLHQCIEGIGANVPITYIFVPGEKQHVFIKIIL